MVKWGTDNARLYPERLGPTGVLLIAVLLEELELFVNRLDHAVRGKELTMGLVLSP